MNTYPEEKHVRKSQDEHPDGGKPQWANPRAKAPQSKPDEKPRQTVGDAVATDLFDGMAERDRDGRQR